MESHTMTITVKLPGDQQVVLDKDHILVGRDPDCDVRLPDNQGVKSRHATINKVAGRWLIQSEGDWLLQVGSGVPGRKCWLKTNDVIHLTEAGPDIVFVQGHLPAPPQQQFSNGEPPVALVEPAVSPDARPDHLSDAGTGAAGSTAASTFSVDTARTLAPGSPSSNRDDQPIHSPPPLPFPISALPQQRPSAKRFVARMVIPACWLGVVVIAIGTIWFALEWNKTRKLRFAVDFGGELWGKGAKDQAVEQYRPILPILAPDDRAAVIYQRVIEFDVEKGNRESAKSLIHQALERGVILAFDTREAAGLLANIKSKSTVEEADDDDTAAAAVVKKRKEDTGKATVSVANSKRPKTSGPDASPVATAPSIGREGSNVTSTDATTANGERVIKMLQMSSSRIRDLLSDLQLTWECTRNAGTTDDGREIINWVAKHDAGSDGILMLLVSETNGRLFLFQCSMIGPGDGEISEEFGKLLAETTAELTGWPDCPQWLASHLMEVIAQKCKRDVVHEGIRVSIDDDDAHKAVTVLIAGDAMLRRKGIPRNRPVNPPDASDGTEGTSLTANQPPLPTGARKLQIQVGTVGIEGDMSKWRLRNNNDSLKALKCYATNDNLIIEFDVDPSKWVPIFTSYPLLVRLFDRNGQHLTHFRTAEGFTVFSNIHKQLRDAYRMRERAGVRADMLAQFNSHLLESHGNRLVYQVNVRDLRDAAMVEIGFVERE
jgi:hypothetical protein